MKTAQPELRFRGGGIVVAVLALTASLAALPQGARAVPDPEAALLTPAVRASLEAVRAEGIRDHVRFLADDRLEGRNTSSPGTELAARYLADRLREFGLKPAGENGSFFQSVPLTQSRMDAEHSHLTVRAGDNSARLSFGSDFLLNGLGRQSVRLELPVVFAGYGIRAPEYQYDDYKDLDVKGSLVVTLAGEPPSEDPNFFQGARETRYANGGSKIQLARSLGAAGIVSILTGPRGENYPWDRELRFQTASRLSPPTAADAPFVSLTVREAAAARLFQVGGLDLPEVLRASEAGRPPRGPLAGRARIELALESTPSPSPNVLARLDGSDPALKDQVIVYTAHYDHLGRREGGEGDTIFNGAWDNASGTSGVLEIARGFAAMRPAPRRSILFLFVTGEERGLWGSDYYVRNPVVPIEKTAANINLDMTDIFGLPKQIVPLGAERSSIMAHAQSVARVLRRTIGPDPVPDLGVYRRSDQFSFARMGVPAVFMLWSNEYEDLDAETARKQAREKLATIYHKVTDEFDPTWSWEGMRRHAQASLLLGLSLASQDEMPRWNEGDPFNKPRGAVASIPAPLRVEAASAPPACTFGAGVGVPYRAAPRGPALDSAERQLLLLDLP